MEFLQERGGSFQVLKEFYFEDKFRLCNSPIFKSTKLFSSQFLVKAMERTRGTVHEAAAQEVVSFNKAH